MLRTGRFGLFNSTSKGPGQRIDPFARCGLLIERDESVTPDVNSVDAKQLRAVREGCSHHVGVTTYGAEHRRYG